MGEILRVLRIACERGVDEPDRFAHLAVVERDHAEQKVGVGELWRTLEDLDTAAARLSVGTPVQGLLCRAVKL